MLDTTEEAIRAGEHAAAMLDEPALKSALDSLEADYLAVWRNSKLADTATREDAFRMLKTLDAFKGELERRVAEGRLARAMAEERDAARVVEGMAF